MFSLLGTIYCLRVRGDRPPAIANSLPIGGRGPRGNAIAFLSFSRDSGSDAGAIPDSDCRVRDKPRDDKCHSMHLEQTSLRKAKLLSGIGSFFALRRWMPHNAPPRVPAQLADPDVWRRFRSVWICPVC